MTITLIEFSVENYKIFKEKQTFSMTTDVKDEKRFFAKNGEKLLRSSLIYGQNASGKTTILQALRDLKSFMFAEKKISEVYNPFSLSNDLNEKSNFEIVFAVENINYVYSVEINKDRVIYEKFEKDNKKVFERMDEHKEKIKLFDDFDIEANKNIFTQQTPKDMLYIYALSQWKNDFIKDIMNKIKDIIIIDGVDSQKSEFFTKSIINNPEQNKVLLDHIKKADFGIELLKVIEIDIPEEFKKIVGDNERLKKDFSQRIISAHSKFDSDGEKKGQQFILIEDESSGTRDFLNKISIIMNILDNGKVLFIDELDNSLHPHLTKYIVQLFESPKTNPNNAQLIATTHDTSLIGSINKELLIKDQVWFTEKNEFGEGTLFSLSDMENNDKYLRNDMEFQNKYLEGRFGAVPFINDLEL